MHLGGRCKDLAINCAWVIHFYCCPSRRPQLHLLLSSSFDFWLYIFKGVLNSQTSSLLGQHSAHRTSFLDYFDQLDQYLTILQGRFMALYDCHTWDFFQIQNKAQLSANRSCSTLTAWVIKYYLKNRGKRPHSDHNRFRICYSC